MKLTKTSPDNTGLKDYIDLGLLTKDHAAFTIGDYDNISLTYKGQTYTHVRFYRSFPLSSKDVYISVKDEEDKEIGLIENLADLDQDLASKIHDKLALRYFCPSILKIEALKEEYGYCYFTVTTEAGPRDFIVNRHDRPLKRLEDDRYLLNDMDGNRFFMTALESYEEKYVKIIENLL